MRYVVILDGLTYGVYDSHDEAMDVCDHLERIVGCDDVHCTPEYSYDTTAI